MIFSQYYYNTAVEQHRNEILSAQSMDWYYTSCINNDILIDQYTNTPVYYTITMFKQ